MRVRSESRKRSPRGARVALCSLALVIGCGSTAAREAAHEASPDVTSAPVAAEPMPDGVELRQLRHQGDDYRVVSVDLRRVDLDLYGLTSGEGDVKTIPALRSWLQTHGRRLSMATNSGIFGTAGRPVGLHIERGREQQSLNLDSGLGNFFLKPNAVFYLHGLGATPTARVVQSESFHANPRELRLATQSGPALVLHGSVNAAFTSDSTSLKVRSGVGVSASDPHVVHFAISEGPVRFYDFATLFRDALECSDALYLDGSISVLCAPDCGASEHANDSFGGLLAVTVPASPSTP